MRTRRIALFVLSLSLTSLVPAAAAQAPRKRPLTHEDYDGWRSIAGTTLSRDGRWVADPLTPQDGDAVLEVRQLAGDAVWTHPRGTEAQFTEDGRWLVFLEQPRKEDVRAFRRNKLKEKEKAGEGAGATGAQGGSGAEPAAGPPGGGRRGRRGGASPDETSPDEGGTADDQAPQEPAKKDADDPAEPKPALGIMNLADGKVTLAPRVKSFQVPREGPAVVAFLLEKEEPKKPASGPASRPESEPGESRPARRGGSRAAESRSGERTGESRTGERTGESRPAESRRSDPAADKIAARRKDGTPLVVRELDSGREQRFEGVSAYGVTRKKAILWFVCSSKKDDAKVAEGVHALDLKSNQHTTLVAGTGDYQHVTTDREVTRLCFLGNRDDFKADKPVYGVYAWDLRSSGATQIASSKRAAGAPARDFPAGRRVSTARGLVLSRDGDVLLFGAVRDPLPDLPPLLDDEKVTMDLWHWQDGQLQTQQAKRVEQLRNESIDCAWHFGESRLVRVGDETVERLTFLTPDGSLAMGTDEEPYQKVSSWDTGYVDVWLVNTLDGTRHKVLSKLRGAPSASPTGRWLVWFDADRQWHGLDTANRTARVLTSRAGVAWHVEDWDQPSPARSWGFAGWLENDAGVLVQDHYDVWRVALDGTTAQCVTDGYGRANKIEFRPLRLDPEAEAFANDKPLLLAAQDDETKATGWFEDSPSGVGKPRKLVMLDKSVGGLVKASKSDARVFTVQTFAEFPDLWTAAPDFSGMRRITDANPQQRGIAWGNAEIVTWTSGDGAPLKGLLVKPEGFDPARRYPMLVNIYEKLSEGLHRYHAPAPGTSPNATFYVSNGYLWFAPDIVYTVGYPGESCLKCVVPGIQSLIARGFVDEKAIGISGHSWGGYQTVYLATRTNLFAAIEAGAAVCDMISAYGGIRYGTGVSRQFQYEQTQSRIGGSVWDFPLRFIDNSPVFRLDQVATPMLILHNDQDGAVPFTQGIELFTALRRLEKKAWLCNYVGEDHGLRKRANMKDWSVRMQEFFDCCLKGASQPKWMKSGVPFVEREREKVRNLAQPAEASVTLEGQER